MRFMAASKWHTQKASASTKINGLLADGQEKHVDAIVNLLKEQGIGRKNALKAIYAEVAAGKAVLSVGTWSDGSFKKAGA